MKSDQLPFIFDVKEERAKRDRALDLFESRRMDILDAARQAAADLYLLNERVTAPEVFALLRARGFEDVLERIDPRFMGAVFRERTGWRRIGFENKGSHCRPVSIWIRAESKKGNA